MTTSMKANYSIERISSGSSETDLILNGGFPKNSINIIMGSPGSGKTIFAEQLMFKNAGDRPILYLTTLSEPVGKIIRYLQGFSFYNEAALGTDVIYEDIGPAVTKEGVNALNKRIKSAILEQSPKIIIVDSFKDLHYLTQSVAEMRRHLYEFTSMITAYDTTVFLIGEYTTESLSLPEFTAADGIIELLRTPLGTRDERFVRVLKLRGSSYLEGSHAFKISQHGLEVFPRLVTPEIPKSFTLLDERITSGVEGLDELLHGGFLVGSTTLLAGPTGAGKTTIALQFAMDGVRQGIPALFVNFEENPTQLERTIKGLGGNLETLKAEGLHLLYASPVELQMDSIIVSMFARIEELGIKRIVIDSVGDLITTASDPQRLHDYIYALTQHFTVRGVTSIVTFETLGGLTDLGFKSSGGGRFSYMSDNIILLQVGLQDRIKRTLSILKERASSHDLGVNEIEITKSGIRVKK
mgnify:CR=1 FL=1